MKSFFTPSSPSPPSPPPTQTDEALRLLAALYARRFQAAIPGDTQPRHVVYWHACEQIRAVLDQATSQHDALTRLATLSGQVEEAHANRPEEADEWRTTVGKAQALVGQVIQAGGNARVLLAGESDGFRHLCLHCSQDERNFQQVRFFDHQARRPFLTVEARNVSRSFYSRCQICKQVLAPLRFVVAVPAGTIKHQHGCSCLHCNQAGVAHLLKLYACDETRHAILLPPLAQIAAPSRSQANDRAFSSCGEKGWYMLFAPHPQAF